MTASSIPNQKSNLEYTFFLAKTTCYFHIKYPAFGCATSRLKAIDKSIRSQNIKNEAEPCYLSLAMLQIESSITIRSIKISITHDR
jgi:hypothetical protein